MNISEYAPNRIIYLDSDFISSMYEEITGESPKTQFTKAQSSKGGGSLGIMRAEVQSQETRSFGISSIEMLGGIFEKLEEYPDFDASAFKNYSGTQTVWLKGLFTMGEWSDTTTTKDGDKSENYVMFEMKSEGFDIAFLVQPESFSSNIASLVGASKAIRRYIGIPALALGRVLYFVEDANRYVVAPYLIIEPSDEKEKEQLRQIASTFLKQLGVKS